MRGPSDLFVGRAAELDRLVGALPGGGRGSGLVLVVGEPGIGKSRLLDQLSDDRRADGARVQQFWSIRPGRRQGRRVVVESAPTGIS